MESKKRKTRQKRKTSERRKVKKRHRNRYIFFCNSGICIHSCPFITPGLRRTPKAKQRQEKVEEQKVDVPEEKDEPAQKNEEAPSESVHSRVLSIVFVISFLYVGRLFFFSF